MSTASVSRSKIFQASGALEPGELKLDWITDDLRQEALSYLPPFGG